MKVISIHILISLINHINLAESFTTTSRTTKSLSKTNPRTSFLWTNELLKCKHQENGNLNPSSPSYYNINSIRIPREHSYLHSSKSIDIVPPNDKNKDSTLDKILSKLTSAFPLFVLSSALLGYACPSTLDWVSKSNNGELISIMLSGVMIGMGMTLETKDFEKVIIDQKFIVPIGVICQFVIMPILACALGKAFILPIDKALYLGFVLIGCVPGGTASNLVSLIAGADVALSVVLTSISTILASFGESIVYIFYDVNYFN